MKSDLQITESTLRTSGWCTICNGWVPAYSDGTKLYCANLPAQTPDDGAHFWRQQVSIFATPEEREKFRRSFRKNPIRQQPPKLS